MPKLLVYQSLVLSIAIYAVEAVHMKKAVGRKFRYFRRGALMTMLNVSPFTPIT
jgi:hypothetical protein